VRRRREGDGEERLQQKEPEINQLDLRAFEFDPAAAELRVGVGELRVPRPEFQVQNPGADIPHLNRRQENANARPRTRMTPLADEDKLSVR